MVAVSSVQLSTLQAKSGIQQTQENKEDPEAKERPTNQTGPINSLDDTTSLFLSTGHIWHAVW